MPLRRRGFACKALPKAAALRRPSSLRSGVLPSREGRRLSPLRPRFAEAKLRKGESAMAKGGAPRRARDPYMNQNVGKGQSCPSADGPNSRISS